MLSNLRHYFLPHHTNNFRARALHSQIFAIYAILLLVLGVSFKFLHQNNHQILGFATDIYVDQLVTFTNQKRLENGLSPLKYNAELSDAAAKKAADMFSKDYWAHVAPDGKTPWDFINSVGYIYTVAGENLAKNFNDSEGVVTAWMNSPSHRENLLRAQYEDVGFAVMNGKLNGEETTLVVQMFGKTLSAVPVTQKTATNNPLVAGVQAASEVQTVPLHQVDVSTPAVKIDSPNTGTFFGLPLTNIGTFPKALTLGFFGLLGVILAADAVYVWKHRIVRIGGKVSAHLLFLLALTGIVGILSLGSIL
jgi:hypothetical protein